MRRALAAVWLTCLALGAGPARAQQEEPAETLGSAAAFGVESKTIAVAQGTTLYVAPAQTSEITGLVDSATELQVREQRGAWVQVEYQGYLGWLRPDLLGGRDLVSGVERQVREIRQQEAERAERLAAARAEHVRRLQRAMDLMPQARQSDLGPFKLLSELPSDSPLLGELRTISKAIESALLRRLGLFDTWPGTEPGALELRLQAQGQLEERDQIILFSGQRQYQDYLKTEGDLGGLDIGGHAIGGTAVLFIGDIGDIDAGGVVSSFVHETVHLASFRLFGGRLPHWLEEGLAEDIAWSRIGDKGEIQLGSFQRVGRRTLVTRQSRSVRVWLPGELAQVCEAARAWRRAVPDPRSVLDLDFTSFVDPVARVQNYTLAGMLTRALVESDGLVVRELAAALRRDLLGLLQGGSQGRTEVLIDASAAAEMEIDMQRQLGQLSGACGALARRSG